MGLLEMIALGIFALYMVTTFIMIQDIRDNTRELVQLLEDTAGDTDDA